MHKEFKKGLVWFRRDLRVHDNAALSDAILRCEEVLCVFVFDRSILDALPRYDRRVEFIHGSVVALDAALRALAEKPEAGLIVLHATAEEGLPSLASELLVDAVFTARDYEPYARQRDDSVRAALRTQGIAMVTVKDHVIFEERELLTQMAKPYGVFTPYMRSWLAKLEQQLPAIHSNASADKVLGKRPSQHAKPPPSLQTLGFEATNLLQLGIAPGEAGATALLNDFVGRLDRYDETRNFPSVKGPSYLGVHLRFGTVSIRQLVHLAYQEKLQGSAGASTWLGELVWRDFYFQILANFPQVSVGAFKPDYDAIVWESGELAQLHFAAWCEGRTGYPIVDAAMAQLNQTGYMHNRLRMVAGSFLVKHLGIDWRWGERYFAEKLNDFDLSANNGGWQWVSSSGCDAQPYFRIFNPVTQSEKFDADGKFIRRYIPQLAKLDAKSIHAPWAAKPLVMASAGVVLGENYPQPIVDHAEARAATLARYGIVRKTD
ncbi:MAG: deoxyribodipyrimidine photolyase [Burkholderiales bacterium PBB3]|nr:MAG: deoxyribodipyrimidine photolyase [Burkholderiales bacterium PBB3]